MRYLITGRKKQKKLPKIAKEKKPLTPALREIKAQTRALNAEKERSRQEKFKVWCESMGLPTPVPEYAFALETGPNKGRRWKIDFYFEAKGKKLAVEVEGGVLRMGRHQRPDGFRKDMEKYNALVAYGISLFRCEPKKLMTLDTAWAIKRFFNEQTN